MVSAILQNEKNKDLHMASPSLFHNHYTEYLLQDSNEQAV